MIKAVLFDLYDTLLERDQEKDAEIDLSIVNAARQLGYDVYPKEFQTARAFFWRLYNRRGKVQNSLELAKVTFDELGVEFDEKDLLKNVVPLFNQYSESIHLYPGALSCIKQLHERKYALGIVANAGFNGYWNTRRFGLDAFFKSIVISFNVNVRKPHPEIFQKALTELGVSAEQSVFVGDDIEDDIFGAQRLGMKTILVARQPPEGFALKEIRPDFEVQTLKEVPALVEKLTSK